jgi:hypothetical protein
MKKLKIIAGITWSFVCLILIIILFPRLSNFSSLTASLPFMKINPNYSGGVVAQRLINEGCTLEIRKPVFDGLFRERDLGFVQVDWRGRIPDKIRDTIDYNSDNIPDFLIMVDRVSNVTSLDPITSKVKKVTISTPTSYGWAVRVGLSK